jgi:hypothetical protein
MNPVSEIAGYARREPVLFVAFVSIPIIAILNFLVFIPIQNAVRMHELGKATDQLKQNLHSYQIALERCGSDSEGGTYPTDFDELIEKGYLDGLLDNPYYGLVDGAPPKMLQKRPGEFVPGCVIYVTNDRSSSYKLVALGWWVDGWKTDEDAVIRFAPPLTTERLNELGEYVLKIQRAPGE